MNSQNFASVISEPPPLFLSKDEVQIHFSGKLLSVQQKKEYLQWRTQPANIEHGYAKAARLFSETHDFTIGSDTARRLEKKDRESNPQNWAIKKTSRCNVIEDEIREKLAALLSVNQNASLTTLKKALPQVSQTRLVELRQDYNIEKFIKNNEGHAGLKNPTLENPNFLLFVEKYNQDRPRHAKVGPHVSPATILKYINQKPKNEFIEYLKDSVEDHRSENPDVANEDFQDFVADFNYDRKTKINIKDAVNFTKELNRKKINYSA